MKVEIDELFHKIAELLLKPHFSLSSLIDKFLISLVAKKVEERKLAPTDAIIACCNKVYIIRPGKPVSFDDSFSIFNKAVEILAKEENKDKSCEIVEQKITKAYETPNFFCEIFPTNLLGVCGYFCHASEKGVYIMFFAYTTDEDDYKIPFYF